MSFNDQLLAQTQSERAALLQLPIIEQALCGQISREHYLAFLQQAYQHVRHSVPLLMACAARLPATSLSYLRSHGELDAGHLGFCKSLIDRLDDADEQYAVIHAARRFYRLYGEILRSLRGDELQLEEAA